MRTSETTKEINQAMFKFQETITKVTKDGVNPHFKNTYPTLEKVLNTVMPELHKLNIIVLQGGDGEGMSDNTIFLTTRLIHNPSGEWLESDMAFPISRQDPQAGAATLTYLRRYSLLTLLGLGAEDDDDAETAVTHPKPAVVKDTVTATCPIHRVTMEQKEGKYGLFWSHKTADGWCQGKRK